MEITTMKAIRIHQYGGQQTLREEQVAIPQISEDDVLIAVKYSGINPVDWKVREGWLASENLHQLPLILGWDLAGVVEQVGENVTQFQAGDEVYAFSDLTKDGAYAQYISVNAALVAKKPRSLSFAQAAAVPLTALTAWQAMHQLAKIETGQSVLIHGASGGVGSFAVQFAMHLGARVTAVASTGNHSYLQSLGVEHVADYRQPNYLQALGQFDYVFDVVDNDTQGIYDTVKPCGKYISTLKTHQIPARYTFAHERVLVMPSGEQLSHIGALIDQGAIQLPSIQQLPLDAVAQAHALSETEHVQGKIVLQI
ncbi:NADP-dependent oxidoreductase [Vibrio navarrensis]|uniref:NADP-dependent oxidoreductase n=1 Tax=Vibrio navarrensis TaxID=29495 RepID=A0AAI9CWY6_9VIBR|nr:NADP-dependent oxidoreductase [Vibrio navarrensis]EGR2797714.1 NADP-dependent oxidoreductase [Vibrio navarrensis]EKA5636863.1 NADP-dependent oxidoreductase [Vibrio navarrensis]ELN6934180.1 NADP-dependent oxidoreductase [Vibrio navarrensis]